MAQAITIWNDVLLASNVIRVCVCSLSCWSDCVIRAINPGLPVWLRLRHFRLLLHHVLFTCTWPTGYCPLRSAARVSEDETAVCCSWNAADTLQALAQSRKKSRVMTHYVP